MKRLIIPLLFGLGSCFNPTFEEGGLQCADSVDNDGDGLLDCEEEACASTPTCAAECGDAIIEGQEECDDGAENSDVNPNACRTDCTRASCGDNVIDINEQCEGSNIGQTCQDLGFLNGVPSCDGECQIDTSTCDSCGNNVRDGNEECDGGDIDGQDCSSLGLGSGSVFCSPDCSLNTALCQANFDICDNGIDDDGDGLIDCEDCFDCGVEPFCATTCDPEFCENGFDDDGDGLIDCQDEDCVLFIECQENCGDGLDNDADGFTDCDDCADCGNDIFCKGGCTAEPICDDGFDDDGDGLIDCEDFDCVAFPACAPVCADGNRELGEQCDDGNTFNGEGCSAACLLEGVVQESEFNDEIATADLLGAPNVVAAGGASGSDIDFFAVNLVAGTIIAIETAGAGGLGSCNDDTLLSLFDIGGASQLAFDDDNGVGNCSLITFNITVTGTYFIAVSAFAQSSVPVYLLFVTDVTPAQLCGNGVINAGEECDGTNFNGQDCATLGFPGGTLACAASCTFNTSGCNPPAQCGDGTINAGEQCDDGNTSNNDGCSSVCLLENVAQENESNDSAATANFIGNPNTIAAGTTAGTDLDFFAITIFAGTVIEFETAGFGGQGTCDGDTLLALFDLDGVTQLASDDDNGFGACSLISFTVPVTGTYFIRVNPFNQGNVPGYLLFVTNVTPAQFCGNNVAEFGESCDGSDLAGSTCDSATGGIFPEGNVTCDAGCSINTSGCF